MGMRVGIFLIVIPIRILLPVRLRARFFNEKDKKRLKWLDTKDRYEVKSEL